MRPPSTFSNGAKGDKQALSKLLESFSKEELKPLFVHRTGHALKGAIDKKSVQDATLMKGCGGMGTTRYTRVKELLFEESK